MNIPHLLQCPIFHYAELLPPRPQDLQSILDSFDVFQRADQVQLEFLGYTYQQSVEVVAFALQRFRSQ